MSKAKEFPREVASRQQKGWQLRSRTPQTTPRAGDCKQAQSERQMGADQSGKGQVIECVSSKDSGFYFEGDGLLRHQRVFEQRCGTTCLRFNRIALVSVWRIN